MKVETIKLLEALKEIQEVYAEIANEPTVEVSDNLVKGIGEELKEYWVNFGGCDHSVGICACELKRLTEYFLELTGKYKKIDDNPPSNFYEEAY